jgi:hypothetical protein
MITYSLAQFCNEAGWLPILITMGIATVILVLIRLWVEYKEQCNGYV